MEISISWVFRDLPNPSSQFSSQIPCVWAQQALALPLDTVGGMHTPQPLQCTISAEETVGFPAVRPIAAAQEGKCMLNGEVAAVNTQLRNMVGEIHQAAGLWGGGSPGVAHVYHSLLLCPFSLGGGVGFLLVLLSGLPFHSLYSLSTFLFPV